MNTSLISILNVIANSEFLYRPIPQLILHISITSLTQPSQPLLIGQIYQPRNHPGKALQCITSTTSTSILRRPKLCILLQVLSHIYIIVLRHRHYFTKDQHTICFLDCLHVGLVTFVQGYPDPFEHEYFPTSYHLKQIFFSTFSIEGLHIWYRSFDCAICQCQNNIHISYAE